MQAKAQEPVPGQDAVEKAAQAQEASEMEVSTAAVESQVSTTAAIEELDSII